jgi:hypothetical protein
VRSIAGAVYYSIYIPSACALFAMMCITQGR